MLKQLSSCCKAGGGGKMSVAKELGKKLGRIVKIAVTNTAVPNLSGRWCTGGKHRREVGLKVWQIELK